MRVTNNKLGSKKNYKTLNICLSQPKISKKPQMVYIGSLHTAQDIVCLSAVFQFKPFFNGQDNNELKFSINGFQLSIESLVGQNYEITKICRVVGSVEIIVEVRATAGKPKPIDHVFEPIIYKMGDKFKIQLMSENNSGLETICQNIYVV